ncbi:MAG: hypothetical protein EXR77_09365 [Myxococcales bacterium]|nr:hypothetical protein [Myxococcales bacterium]
MLDAFIIDQIRKQQDERRLPRSQPYAEPPGSFPLERPPQADRDVTSRREDDEFDGRIVFDM